MRRSTLLGFHKIGWECFCRKVSCWNTQEVLREMFPQVSYSRDWKTKNQRSEAQFLTKVVGISTIEVFNHIHHSTTKKPKFCREVRSNLRGIWHMMLQGLVKDDSLNSVLEKHLVLPLPSTPHNPMTASHCHAICHRSRCVSTTLPVAAFSLYQLSRLATAWSPAQLQKWWVLCKKLMQQTGPGCKTSDPVLSIIIKSFHSEAYVRQSQGHQSKVKNCQKALNEQWKVKWGGSGRGEKAQRQLSSSQLLFRWLRVKNGHICTGHAVCLHKIWCKIVNAHFFMYMTRATGCSIYTMKKGKLWWRRWDVREVCRSNI